MKHTTTHRVPRGCERRPDFRRRQRGVWLGVCGLALFCALAALPFTAAEAQQQITTDHFFIYYQKNTEDTARRIAEIADEAYDQLADIFKFYEDHPRIHVIARDDMDFGNGWSKYFENVITIWATNLDSELRGPHSWVKNAFVHELTHVISLNIASKGPINLGLAHIGRHNEETDFSLVLPAYHLAVPEWFSEGVAQHQDEVVGYESWDTHRDMLLRMAALENDLLSYDEMGIFAHDGLHSEMVYNQGYALVRYIADRFGPEKVEALTRNSALLNFNSSVRQALGSSATELYENWKSQTVDIYQSRKEALGTIVEGDKDADDGFLEFYPTYSPDGKKLAYLSNEDRDFAITKIRIRDLETGKTRTLDKKVYSRFSWTPDSRKLVYARLGGSTLYFDLFVYDLETDEEQRISAGLRAKDPAVSPDGEKIVFVGNKDGSNNIGVLSMDGSDVRYLSHNHHGIQYLAPQWSPNGKQILFGVYQGEDRDIAVINAACTPYSKKLASADSSAFPDSLAFPEDADFKVIVNSEADERDACWSPDGESILFSSDRGGIFNLYEYTLEAGAVKQASNVLGGAFAPCLAPDGEDIAYAGYHAADHSIYRLGRGAYEQARDWDSTSRDYLALADAKPLKEEYSVTPYSRKCSLSGIYPIVSLGPAFIGEKVGLETLSAGVQVSAGDVLGANRLVAAFTLGKNLKEDIDWNSDLEVFYSRRLGSVFTQNSVLTPNLYAYYGKLTLHDLDKEHWVQDVWTEGTLDGTPVTRHEHLEDRLRGVSKYDYARVFCGIEFPLRRRQGVAVEYGYRNYWQASAWETTAEYQAKFFDGDVDITEDVRTSYPEIVIDTTFSFEQRVRDLGYFTSHDVSLYWSYAKVTPTKDLDINPTGGRRIDVALRRTTSTVTDSITFLDSEGITAEYKQDAEDIAINELVGSWREYLGVGRGRDALSLWLLAGYKNRNIRTTEEGGNFYWPLRYYLGGQGTLRGYPYFALSGSRMLFVRAAYTFPIFQNINWQFLNVYFDKLYGAVFAEAGAAWNSGPLKDVKTDDFLRDVGAELKMKLFTFYRLPLVAYFQVVKPLDKSRLERWLEADGELDKRDEAMLDSTYEPKFYFGLRFPS